MNPIITCFLPKHFSLPMYLVALKSLCSVLSYLFANILINFSKKNDLHFRHTVYAHCRKLVWQFQPFIFLKKIRGIARTDLCLIMCWRTVCVMYLNIAWAGLTKPLRPRHEFNSTAWHRRKHDVGKTSINLHNSFSCTCVIILKVTCFKFGKLQRKGITSFDYHVLSDTLILFLFVDLIPYSGRLVYSI